MRDITIEAQFALMALSQAVLFLLPVGPKTRGTLSLGVIAAAIWLLISRTPVLAPISKSTETTLGLLSGVAMLAMAIPQAWGRELPAERWHRKLRGD